MHSLQTGFVNINFSILQQSLQWQRRLCGMKCTMGIWEINSKLQAQASVLSLFHFTPDNLNPVEQWQTLCKIWRGGGGGGGIRLPPYNCIL